MGFPSLDQYDIFLWIELNWTCVCPGNESTLLHLFCFLRNFFGRSNRILASRIFNYNWFSFLLPALSNQRQLVDNTTNIPLNNKTHFISWIQCSFFIVKGQSPDWEMWWFILLTKIGLAIILHLAKLLILLWMLLVWYAPEAYVTVEISRN